MHESGLAVAIAETLRRQHADGRIRVLVSGGHHEPEDFDASLRFHLALAAPEYDADAIEIVHLATDRLCASCGATFEAPAGRDACPACGGIGLPVPTPERVEIEMERPSVVGP